MFVKGKRQMKYRIILIISLLMLISFIAASIALAEERFMVFEMGEGGHTVEFPMTSEEIASEDAEISRRDALREAKLKKPKKHVVVFELAESGIIIEFPDTTSDIYAGDAGE